MRNLKIGTGRTANRFGPVSAALSMAVALGAGSLAMTPGAAQAQEVATSGNVAVGARYDRPDFRMGKDDPLSHVGGFLFDGGAALNVTYNDNIYFQEKEEVDDVLFLLSPYVNIRSNFPRHWLNLGLNAQVGTYADNSDDNFVHGGFTLDTGLNLTRQWDIGFDAGVRADTEPRGDNDETRGTPIPGERTQKMIADVSIGSEVRFVRMDLSGNVSYKMLDFSDIDATTGPDFEQDDRDREIIGVDGQVAIVATDRVRPYFEFAFNSIDYDQADVIGNGAQTVNDRDGNQYSAVIGVQLDFTGLLSGSAAVGYQARDFKNDDAENIGGGAVRKFETIEGPKFDIEVSWLPTPLLAFDFSVGQLIGETSIVQSGGFLATEAKLDMQYEILRSLVLGAHVAFDNRDYESIDRTDDRFRTGFGLDWDINRYLTANAKYRFIDRTSNLDAFEYTQNIITVGLNGRF